MSEQKQEHKNIHEATNAIMREVGYVQKERNDQLKYAYASESMLIQAVRPVMVEHGVYVFPAKVESLALETYETKGGTTMNRTVALFTFCFVHAPSDTSFEVQVIGEGADINDKSSNKAMTNAFKYALRQTFCIETGDADAEASDQQRQNGNRQQAPQRPWKPEAVKAQLYKEVKARSKEEREAPMDADGLAKLSDRLGDVFDYSDHQEVFLQEVFGKELSELTQAEGRVLWRWADERPSAKKEAEGLLASIDQSAEKKALKAAA